MTPLRHLGPPRVDGAALCVRQDVLEQLVYASLHGADELRTCVLLGEYRLAPVARVVDVSGYADLSPYTTTVEFARELAAEWERTTGRLARGHRGHVVVGWAALRPGGRAALQPTDHIAHRTLFNRPWQVHLAIDGAHEEIACYGLDQRGYLINVGFNVVTGWESPAPTPSRSSSS